MIDRYKPKKDSILEGGMSNAIICQDTVLERVVILKTLKTGTDKSRIVDEIKALQRLRSKHVVEIYDIIEGNDGSLTLVEEYLPGPDLIAQTCVTDISLDEFIRILYQISSGIKDIHNVHLVHRDIKPNNMKYDKENYLKIFDFGLAREIDVNNSTIGFKGTPLFAAPELYSNDKIKFTSSVDTYAFGITALIIANCEPPAELKQIPPNPNVGNNYFQNFPNFILPEKISDVLNRCLSFDPDLRPSMKVIYNEFAKYLLRGKHRALLCHNENSSIINNKNKIGDFNYEGVGRLKIEYDNFDFKIVYVQGEVYVNNSPAFVGQYLPGACVITFGHTSRRNNRAFLTFDISHPEVTI